MPVEAISSADPKVISMAGQRERRREPARRHLIGHSRQMRDLLELVDRAAGSASSVVIAGESGAGKELVARSIHELSPRHAGPFIAVNCAALPETLMESELFGHERGAFTGADSRRAGCFELANGGTLLLDEIAEMKPAFQAKLLRALEERRFRRLGGGTEVAVDVRVLAATNRDLGKAVGQGGFRLDLYYRLNVMTIELPPLRERPGDIPELVDYFLGRMEQPAGGTIAAMDAEALEKLRGYSWPGNVRQLRNVIERALIVTRGPLLTVADLPREIVRDFTAAAASSFEVRLGASLEQTKAELFRRTLEFAGGNKSRAAEILGVSLKTLYNNLEQSPMDDAA